MNRIARYCRYAFHSLPVQLVIIHIKEHPFFLLFWLFLFTSVLQLFGVSYGIHLLFLDPEYLGHVNFLSFLIVGFAMGGFIMTWNISFYILNGYRFEFLASLVNPFVQFSFNNSLLPFSFTIVYIISMATFQYVEGLVPAGKVVLNVLALLCGNLLMILSASAFFGAYNQTIEIFIQKLIDRLMEFRIAKTMKLNLLRIRKKHREQWYVECYLRFPFNVGFVRNADFYDSKLVDRVLYLHHKSAFLVQFLSILIMIGLGKMIENPYFRIPAAASIFLILAVGSVLLAFITYVFRGWRTVAVVVLLFVLNFLTQYGLVVYKHQLYGLDYHATRLVYDNEAVNNAVNSTMLNADISQGKVMLENWSRKIEAKYGEVKPKIIFINTAGGGLKATYWTFHVLQELERQTGKRLFDHTILLSGASGGLIGAAYFRDLYFRQKSHEAVDYLDTSYLKDMGEDLLNGIGTSIVTNDIFFPWRNYTYKGFTYKKDRAYMFDLQLNENTHFRMNRPIMDYKRPEQQALIPMMVVGATIINDQRFLFFSPQHISYLIKPYIRSSNGFIDDLSTDAVEYMRFFKDRGAKNLNFIDALRVNATYPYIMPSVYLPTDPEIKALDAGIRENSGFTVSTRFYSVFKDWIDQNTSGAIFISIRVDNKLRDFDIKEKETYINELISPVGSIFNNFILLQDYNSDIGLSYLESSGSSPIQVLNFNYDERRKLKKASMSWHLTRLEKRDIRDAFRQADNQRMLQKLRQLLAP